MRNQRLWRRFRFPVGKKKSRIGKDAGFSKMKVCDTKAIRSPYSPTNVLQGLRGK
jgi:hypothetical protein